MTVEIREKEQGVATEQHDHGGAATMNDDLMTLRNLLSSADIAGQVQPGIPDAVRSPVQQFGGFSLTGILRPERRRTTRRILPKPANAMFYNNGNLYTASIIDLSTTGARLQLRTGTAKAIPEIFRGRKMECYISTPEGRSKCRGTVEWVGGSRNRFSWGISFIELAHERSDPLRAAITNMCRCREPLPATGLAQY